MVDKELNDHLDESEWKAASLCHCSCIMRMTIFAPGAQSPMLLQEAKWLAVKNIGAFALHVQGLNVHQRHGCLPDVSLAACQSLRSMGPFQKTVKIRGEKIPTIFTLSFKPKSGL